MLAFTLHHAQFKLSFSSGADVEGGRRAGFVGPLFNSLFLRPPSISTNPFAASLSLLSRNLSSFSSSFLLFFLFFSRLPVYPDTRFKHSIPSLALPTHPLPPRHSIDEKKLCDIPRFVRDRDHGFCYKLQLPEGN